MNGKQHISQIIMFYNIWFRYCTKYLNSPSDVGTTSTAHPSQCISSPTHFLPQPNNSPFQYSGRDTDQNSAQMIKLHLSAGSSHSLWIYPISALGSHLSGFDVCTEPLVVNCLRFIYHLAFPANEYVFNHVICSLTHIFG